MARARREPIWLAILLGVHLILGILWGAAIPLFEAHDEVGHYYHVRYIARNGHLVPPGETLVDMWDESRQPPLYYVLAAAPVSLVDTSDGPAFTPNPYTGWDLALGGFNAVMHDPAYEAFPWRGGVLAVHVARAVSTVLGALAVWATFAAARRLAPARPAVRWGAGLALAFWPQFRFTASVINNDNLVTLSGALMVLVLVGLLTADVTQRWRWMAAVGGCGALAALSKNNGLPLAVAGGVIALGAMVWRAPRHPWRTAAVVVGLAGLGFALVGWWYARNLDAGKGPFALPFMDVWLYQLRRLFGPEGLGAAQLFERLMVTGRFAWRSLWAAFGWANIGYPSAFYWLAGGWCLVGVGGLMAVRSPVETRSRGAIWPLVLIVVAMLVPTWLVYVATGIPHLQGRYLLPALPAFVILLALGWDRLLPQRAKAWFWGVFAGAMLVVAVLTPWAVIAPAYALPDPMTSDDLAQHTPTLARFGDVVELVGYRLPAPRPDAGGTLDIYLALRVVERSDVPLTLAVKAFDADGRLVGGVHRYPGHGALDTTAWDPTLLFEEHVALPIASTALEGAGRLEISFYHAESPQSPLVVRDGAGTRLGRSLALLEAFRVRGGSTMVLEDAVAHRFGEVLAIPAPDVTLACVGSRPTITVRWAWRVEREPNVDYCLSLQLRTPAGDIVVQRDGPLAEGRIPTRLWNVGEVVPDEVVLPVPRHTLSPPLGLYLIVYDPISGARLPLADADGNLTGVDELLLGQLLEEDLAICADDQRR
ncbi:MAG: DUF2142 domain-containing protein [Anaerolineae bacterium]